MSVALLLVTHKNIATSMMDVASLIINEPLTNYSCTEVPMDAPVDTVISEINKRVAQLDTTRGILVLTDMYGSTPSNIAKEFVKDTDTRLISGLNLPMLIRALNYRDLPIAELAEKIVSGGKQSIQLYEGT